MPKIIKDDEVFQGVIALLIAKGYDGATTSELAAAAGIHEATLFRRYGSKVELVEKAIAHQLSTTPMSQVSYTGDLQADLRRILGQYAATSEQHGEILPFIFLELPRHPELQETLTTPMRNIQRIADIIERYQREGRLKTEHPLITINVLLAPIMVNRFYRRAVDALPFPVIDFDAYLEGFLRGRVVE